MAKRATGETKECLAMIKDRLLYCAETGRFWWREMPEGFFKSRAAYASVKSRFANKEAGTTDDLGYTRIRIGDKGHRAHRVAWAMHYGQWPKDEIDHINGDKKDNRIKNLRSVDRRQNMRNMSPSRVNTSGVPGVHYCQTHKTWTARVSTDKGRKHLGRFANKEDAIAARELHMSRNGYLRTHGRKD